MAAARATSVSRGYFSCMHKLSIEKHSPRRACGRRGMRARDRNMTAAFSHRHLPADSKSAVSEAFAGTCEKWPGQSIHAAGAAVQCPRAWPGGHTRVADQRWQPDRPTWRSRRRPPSAVCAWRAPRRAPPPRSSAGAAGARRAAQRRSAAAGACAPPAFCTARNPETPQRRARPVAGAPARPLRSLRRLPARGQRRARDVMRISLPWCNVPRAATPCPRPPQASPPMACACCSGDRRRLRTAALSVHA